MLNTYRVYRFDVPTCKWVQVLATRSYGKAKELYKRLLSCGSLAIVNQDPSTRPRRVAKARPRADLMKGRRFC